MRLSSITSGPGRALVLLTIVSITAIAAVGASRLRFDNSVEVWFAENDVAVQTYRELNDAFETQAVLAVGAFAPDVLTSDSLAAIDRVTSAVESLPSVQRVRSITNVRVATSTGSDLVIARALDGLSPRAIREHPLLSNKLVAEDSGSALIVVTVRWQRRGDQQEIRDLVDGVQSILHEESRRSSLTWRVAGNPRIDVAFSEYSERDLLVFGPLLLAAVVLITLALFRRFSLALLPLAVVAIANIWTFGLMGALGWTLNAVSTGVVILILAVGVADSIHVISEYQATLRELDDRGEAIAEALRHLFMPCLFTSVTTAAGMLSLLVSDLVPVQQFGVAAAVGVMVAFLLTLTLVPALLGWLPPPRSASPSSGRTGRLIDRLAAPSPSSSRVVALVFVALVGVSTWATATLRVQSGNPLEFFLPDDPVREDASAIDDALGGTSALEVLVRGSDGALLEPDALDRVARLQRLIDSTDGVSWSLSYVDLLIDVQQKMSGRGGLPESQAAASQLALMLEGEEDFGAYVQSDYALGRVTHAVRLSRSAPLIARLPGLQRQIETELNTPTLRFELTGVMKLIAATERYLVESQSRGFAIALLVVTLMLMLLLRSWRLGLLSMIPNCGPVLIGLGGMSAVGIPLDPGTVMVGSICLGLVVDDSAHFLTRLRRELRAGADLEAAISGAMHGTARALISTTVVLTVGFGLFALASFAPNRNFGLISAAIVMLALVADLVVLPAILVLIRPRLGA